jgi:hypothetical protein
VSIRHLRSPTPPDSVHTVWLVFHHNRYSTICSSDGAPGRRTFKIKKSNSSIIRGVTHDFPDDLLAAQLQLHETRAAFDALAGTLPWSADPMTGWTVTRALPGGGEQVTARPDSPGYTDEQRAERDRLHARLLELTATVMTHPYWDTLANGVVKARMALKHVHGTEDTGTA